VITSVHIDTARTWRGGQNQVLQLVTGLESLGHPTWLVAHARGELKQRAQEGLRFVGFAPRSEFDVQAAWQLGRVLKDVKPDVVHAHDPMAVALTAMALQMQNGNKRPLAVAARRVDFHLKQHAFSKWKYRHIDLFIAASGVIAKILETDGVPRDRITVVHDGVNVGVIDKKPSIDVHAEFWLPHGSPVVGNVAALAPHKGQKHLVAAAKLVLKDVPDARFLIIGEGELKDTLERQIKHLALERHVFLTGFRADALGLMKSFDVFAMSSVTEGLGSAVLEAMTCSLPVASTRAGGLPEVVIDGETGLLVPTHDEPELARVLVELLTNADRRKALGAAGRARVIEHFSVETMVARTVAAYEQHKSR
jgi:L-malate glycosyltransferase